MDCAEIRKTRRYEQCVLSGRRTWPKVKEADIGNTEQTTLKVFLPLPPSKNARWKTKGYHDKRVGKYVSRQVLSDSVTLYKAEVNRLVVEQLRKTPCSFTDSWLRLCFAWRVPNLRSDIINYHQDLADALQVPLQVNDKWFMLHDDDVIVDKENPGVEVVVVQ